MTPWEEKKRPSLSCSKMSGPAALKGKFQILLLEWDTRSLRRGTFLLLLFPQSANWGSNRNWWRVRARAAAVDRFVKTPGKHKQRWNSLTALAKAKALNRSRKRDLDLKRRHFFHKEEPHFIEAPFPPFRCLSASSHNGRKLRQQVLFWASSNASHKQINAWI